MPDQLAVSESIGSSAAAALPGFRCTLRDISLDVAWIHVAGELDIATTPRLEDALHDAVRRGRRVVLDLRELVFTDSSGIHAIIEAGRRGLQTGRRLVLLRGASQVDRMFELTGISDVVEIAPVDVVGDTEDGA